MTAFNCEAVGMPFCRPANQAMPEARSAPDYSLALRLVLGVAAFGCLSACGSASSTGTCPDLAVCPGNCSDQSFAHEHPQLCSSSTGDASIEARSAKETIEDAAVQPSE